MLLELTRLIDVDFSARTSEPLPGTEGPTREAPES